MLFLASGFPGSVRGVIASLPGLSGLHVTREPLICVESCNSNTKTHHPRVNTRGEANKHKPAIHSYLQPVASNYRSVTGYIKPDQSASLLESLLYEPQEGFTIKRRLVDADYVIVGHSHIPFSLTFKNIKVFNPGSVGQPRDGDPRASYAILDLETMEFKHYRVKYDVDSVVRKLMELNINPLVVEKLRIILMEGRTP
jgi:hypothetical protein